MGARLTEATPPMLIKSQTRQGIRRITGFVIALGLGAVLGLLGFWLPPTLQGSAFDGIAPANHDIAASALADAELAFFDGDVERYLVTITFVESVSSAAPPEACPDGTVWHARVRARTMWWIPYDNALWCGDDAGRGLFVTRQS